MSDKQKGNRLVREKSPYLQQHAYNPVDWYPWGEEAFSKAKEENKPIFLSIGYSTCHWCHVMEHESFEDNEVAELMNKVFISIKVDREERPDIDKVYMQVAQMMTGRGGWPLTIIMTPDKQPFFAATYIPKENRYSQLGMLSLIPKIKELWENDRENIETVIGRVRDALEQPSREHDRTSLDEQTLTDSYERFSQRFDDKYGGFSRSPKFPSPHNLLFLLRYWKRTGDDWALHMVEKTLKNMRRGGIYDQIGYGFHRYSTDREWLLPHFEKMLYDQAMLLMAYTEAYQITKDESYSEVVEEVITYVLRDMTSEDGVFFSAEDADSEGEEGKFYVWSTDEIMSVLTEREAEVFLEAYNIREEGNFYDEATKEKTGTNIPHLTSSLGAIAKTLGMEPQDVEDLLESSRKKLFEEREKRIRPHLDDKILTDWNGLLIAALAKAARVFDRQDYIEIAERAARFLLEQMIDENGILYHRFKDGERAVKGFLDDYAFMIWGLVELYETTFKPDYLEQAKSLNKKMLGHFWDDSVGGFFFSGDYSEELLTRQKDAYDGAIPSGNSVAAYNLVRLSRLLGNPDLEQHSSDTIEAFSSTISSSPTGFSMMLSALDYALGPSYEIVIAGDEDDDLTREMFRALYDEYIPNKTVHHRKGAEQSDAITRLASFTEFYNKVNEKTTAHVCIEFNCKLPTNDTEQMLQLLGIGG